MVWAEIGEAPKANQIILHTVRLPQPVGADTVVADIRAQADQTLGDCGYSAAEITSARLEIAVLPSAEETEAELAAQLAKGSELIFADLTPVGGLPAASPSGHRRPSSMTMRR